MARNKSDLDIFRRAGQRDFLESWVSDASISISSDCRHLILDSEKDKIALTETGGALLEYVGMGPEDFGVG